MDCISCFFCVCEELYYIYEELHFEEAEIFFVCFLRILYIVFW